MPRAAAVLQQACESKHVTHRTDVWVVVGLQYSPSTYTAHHGAVAPGQGLVLHVRVRSSAGHPAPGVVTVRFDVSTPPPHVTLQDDHSDQSDTWQRGGGGGLGAAWS